MRASVLPVMFAVRFISALLLSHETRWGGNLWMRFLGVWLVAAVFLSVFRDVPAHPGFIFTFPPVF